MKHWVESSDHTDQDGKGRDWEEDTYTDDEDDYSVYDRDTFYDQVHYPLEKWVPYEYGTTRVYVSDRGNIRMDRGISWHITTGTVKMGTPYRIYPFTLSDGTVLFRHVHEVIWDAFEGSVPAGYEVRHATSTTKSGKETYSNALDDLQIFKKE